MSPDKTFSLMKWQSISMCFVLSWNTGFKAMCRAAWLSQMSVICVVSPNCNSLSNCLSHRSSHVAKAIVRYLASALDLAITVCFLLFQKIKLPPKKTLTRGGSSVWMRTYIICIWISHTTRACPLSSYKRPFPGAFLIYFIMPTTASQWSLQGELRNWLTILTTKEISGRVTVR